MGRGSGMYFVRVFLETSMKGPRRGDGWYGYLLETLTKKEEIRTLHQVVMEKDVTANQLYLKALLAALSRLNQECEVEVYTSSLYLRGSYENHLQGWKESGWRTARREPVKNQELWQEVYELGKKQRIRFSSAYQYEYKSWLCTQIAEQRRKASLPGRRRACG